MSSDPRSNPPEEVTRQLARDVSGGDLTQFTRLYERLAPGLLAWARLRIVRELRGRLEPEDLLQEVWIRTLELFPRFDQERGEFRPWVFGVAKNVLLEAVRRTRSGPTLPGAGGDSDRLGPPDVPDSVTSIATRMSRDETVAAFVDHVQGLDPMDQHVLVMFGLEGMRGDEVARRLGIQRDAAFKRWQRLRVRLKELGLGRELVIE